MFTHSKAMWFPVSSKTAEPNTISLLWKSCCIATKFIEMGSKYKIKNKFKKRDSALANSTRFFGTNCRRNAKSIVKYLPPPSVEYCCEAPLLWDWITQILTELFYSLMWVRNTQFTNLYQEDKNQLGN